MTHQIEIWQDMIWQWGGDIYFKKTHNLVVLLQNCTWKQFDKPFHYHLYFSAGKLRMQWHRLPLQQAINIICTRQSADLWHAEFWMGKKSLFSGYLNTTILDSSALVWKYFLNQDLPSCEQHQALPLADLQCAVLTWKSIWQQNSSELFEVWSVVQYFPCHWIVCVIGLFQK